MKFLKPPSPDIFNGCKALIFLMPKIMSLTQPLLVTIYAKDSLFFVRECYVRRFPDVSCLDVINGETLAVSIFRWLSSCPPIPMPFRFLVE